LAQELSGKITFRRYLSRRAKKSRTSGKTRFGRRQKAEIGSTENEDRQQ
jgi:hypothetical protein